MSPEEKELLRRSIALAEENNDILRSIQRSMRLARLMTLLYWAIIIAVAVGSYYFLQPYIDQVMNIYKQASAQLGQINGNLKQATQTYGDVQGQINQAGSGVGDFLNRLKDMIK
jgi:hypothetical protein